MDGCVELNQTELLNCLERWAAWSVRCGRFPRWEFNEIIAEGWILAQEAGAAYDPERAGLYTWLDKVLSNRLPAIYQTQTQMRVWKAGDGVDSLGRSNRATTPFIETVPLKNFFDQNLEDSETHRE